MSTQDAVTSLKLHIRHESRKNFIINFFLNAGIAYGTLHSLSEVSAWGEHGYGKDLLLTGFLLSAILTGIFIAIYRRKRDSDEFNTAGREGQALAWLLPFNPWLAALVFGVLGVILAVPPLLGLLALLEVNIMSPVQYALIKGVWAGLLAWLIIPLAIHQGLRTQPH